MICVWGSKAPIGGAAKRKRTTMSRTYTFQDLQARPLPELHLLRCALQKELALTVPYSSEARKTLANLDAVNHMIRMRSPAGPRC